MYTFCGVSKKCLDFSEIIIFLGNHAVLEFLYLQLFINGKVVHYWSLQDVK
jgi:hypothetical protein